MKTRSLHTAALLTLVAGAAGSAPQTSGASPSGSQQELLSARAVINRYLELTGDGKILASTSSTRTKGRLEIVGTEIAGPMEVLAHESNRRLVQVELDGLGSVREGFDGTTAWSIQPGEGARIQGGLEHLQAALHANYAGPLKKAADFEHIQTIARTDFDGKSCWKIVLVARLPEGMDAQETKAIRTSHEYYNVATGLLVGKEMTTPNGVTAVVVSSNYKKLGERLVATSQLQTAGNLKIRITTDSIAYDDVHPVAFSLPAEVRAKLEEQSKATSTEAKANAEAAGDE